jgi:hypothetical protein
MARIKRVLLWTTGGIVALAVILLSVALWWVSSWYQSEQTDSSRASGTFGEVRARFAGAQAAFEIQGDRLVVVRQPAASPLPAKAVHMLVWRPDQRILSRISLPFSIAIVATEPLPLEALAGVANEGLGALMAAQRRGHELAIRISDLERYGRTLLLDGVAADGKHVLLWNE